MTRTVYIALQQFCETTDAPRRVLREAGLDVRENKLGRRLKKEEIPDVLKGIHAVIAGVEPYDAAVLESLPDLKCISRCGIGTDAIDLDTAKRHNIQVLTTIDEVIEPVAQMTLAMILALARNVSIHLSDFHSRQWRKHTGRLLSEMTIGLIGFGRIGRTVARYLKPLSPRLLVHDPMLKPTDFPPDVTAMDLDALLHQSDVVSLHATRRPDQGALMGPREFKEMKKGSCLVNTARGYLIDETALYDALQSKRLAGAALDVFEEEPYQGPLAQLPQVICTPHVATLTHASRAAMELRASQNVVSFFKNGHSS